MENTRGDVMFFKPTGELVEHFTAADGVNPFVYRGSNVTTLKNLLEERLAEKDEELTQVQQKLAEERAKNAQLQKQLASGSTGRGFEMDQVLASIRNTYGVDPTTQLVPPRMVVPADGKPVDGKTNPGQGK